METNSTESTLPVELKTYLRNLIEENDNRVEDIKGIIMQNFAVNKAMRFLEEVSRSGSLDITLQNKYTLVLESLRSHMPAERSGFVSNMNINTVHNMVVNGQQTPTPTGAHTPSLLEYGEKLGEDTSRLTRYVLEYLGKHGKYQEPAQPLLDGNLKGKVKSILPGHQRHPLATTYCDIHGLHGRENAVVAKIGKILDVLRNQIENKSRKQKKFITLYQEWFPFKNWDPADILSNWDGVGGPSQVTGSNVSDQHPMVPIREDSLQVRYHILRQNDDSRYNRVAECEIACYSKEECVCPEGCVLVSVTRVIPDGEDNVGDHSIDFDPTDEHKAFMDSELTPHATVQWPYKLVIPIPETVGEIRERMQIEKGYADRLEEVEKMFRKLIEPTVGREYITSRAEKIKNAATTLATSRAALGEIEAKLEELLRKIEEELLVEHLQQFIQECPLSHLCARATDRLEDVAAKKIFWRRIVADCTECVAKKEGHAAKQTEDKARRIEEQRDIESQAQEMRRIATEAHKDAQHINTNVHGRQPLNTCENKIDNSKKYERIIQEQVNKLEEFCQIHSYSSVRKALQECRKYLSECQSITRILCRKRKVLHSNAQSRQSDAESHGTDVSNAKTVFARQSGNARVPKPNSRYYPM